MVKNKMEAKNLKEEIIINKAKSFEDIDKDKFSALIESGFKKTLIPNYFSETNPEYICLAEHNGLYVGAIVVESVPSLPGVNYLDKIVVAADYQGNGIATTLWSHLNGYSKKVVWRAKKNNPIIDFYKKKADGWLNFNDVEHFMFFFYGLDSSEFPEAIGQVIGKKPSLIERCSEK